MTATVTTLQRCFLWFAPSLVTAGFLGVCGEALTGNYVPWAVWIAGSIMVPLVWWSYLSVPRRVSLQGNTLVFETPRANIAVAIDEIRRIDARYWNRGHVIITAGRRMIYVLRGMPNLRAVVEAVLDQHPDTKFVGQLP